MARSVMFKLELDPKSPAASIATPPVGKLTMYVGEDGEIYVKDSDGNSQLATQAEINKALLSFILGSGHG